MPVATAAIGAGTSLIGGLIGSKAAQDAAAAQQAAGQKAVNQVGTNTNASLAALNNTWLQDQSKLQPYQDAGAKAVSQLNDATLSADMPNASQIMSLDPGYAFNLSEGTKALQRAEAAGGSIGSGGALKAALQYSQGLASNEFGNAYNRYLQNNQLRFGELRSAADIGQNANSQFIGAGSNYANGTLNANMDQARLDSDLITGMGNAQAAGDIGAANAWSGALSGIGKSAGALALMPSSGSGYSFNPPATGAGSLITSPGAGSLNSMNFMPDLNASGYQLPGGQY